jgi:hypothetical protein
MSRTASQLLALWLLLPSSLLVNAAAIPLTTILHSTTLLTTRTISKDDDDDNRPDDNQLNQHLSAPPQNATDNWVRLAGEILAGVFALIAIFIIVFFLHRRHVRGRRRRLGEMMGLGVKRNEVLEKMVRRRKSGKGRQVVDRARGWRFNVLGDDSSVSSDESNSSDEEEGRAMTVDGREGR